MNTGTTTRSNFNNERDNLEGCIMPVMCDFSAPD